METHEAVALIRDAIPGGSGLWIEYGAGDGTFTRALLELLEPDTKIVAVDSDPAAVAALGQLAARENPNVVPVQGDFTRARETDLLVYNGMLLANSLHFVPDADNVLTRLVAKLKPGGRVVLVEYDRHTANQWVPYPIPILRLPSLAAAAGLSKPIVTATRPSAYQGILYTAYADRLAVSTPEEPSRA